MNILTKYEVKYLEKKKKEKKHKRKFREMQGVGGKEREMESRFERSGWKRYQKENRVCKTSNHKQTLKGGRRKGRIYSRGKKPIETGTKNRALS